MANIHRGQVSLQAGDASYTLSLSTNALCDLEDQLGKCVSEIAELFGTKSVSMSTVRVVFWAALRDYHPDIDLKQAGQIMTDAGMTLSMNAVGRAFKAAFPDQEDADADADKKNQDVENRGSRPRKAKAG